MQGIGHAFILMRYDGDLDELWIGMCLLSPELAQLIVSVFTHAHTHIYRGKILNDVERYVKLLRRREEKGAEEGCNCGVAQSGRVIKVALCM